MSEATSQKAILLLADGTVFHGNAAGKIGTTTGEICFNTGMTGYQEVFTDPSYYRQILVMTTDHIGNYGAMNEETESETVKIAGLVCKNFSRDLYSRPQANESLQKYLVDNDIVSIADLDTRAVVRHIRDKGVMNAIISSEVLDVEELKKMLNEVPNMEGLELSSEVTTTEPFSYGNEGGKKVAVLDLGIKKNILRCMAERGLYMKVFPAKTSFDELKAWEPDGYFLSNGPGDPASMPYAVETAEKMQQTDKPVFGICLGHQIIARANGLGTYKMFNGHRGLNHPVKNLNTGKSEITSQNHGFAVIREDAEASANIDITHVHLNDNTVAGIKIKDKPVFSVQYHPESSPGPHDSRYLFDDFVKTL